MTGSKTENGSVSEMAANRRSRLSTFAIWFAVSTAVFLLDFSYRYLEDLARARTGTFAERFIEEATGVYSAAILFVLVIRFARRFPISRENWLKRLPVYLLGAIAFSAAHTTMMALSRKAIFPLAGMGQYDYGIMPIRYLMEFANYTLWFATGLTLIYLFDYYRSARARELRTAQLETQLAQAQLSALQAQIHPHFLFNALNTISSVIYEDVQAADTMISRLSDFLRHSLKTSQAQEVTLQEELNFLNLYLDIMRPRFEERLNVGFDVEPGITDALAPRLILQPLVENSIKYAADPDSGEVKIAIRATRENGHLRLEVEDGGRQTAVTNESGNGVGLTNTAERLKRLYGSDQEFAIRETSSGGMVATVRLPFHTSAKTN